MRPPVHLHFPPPLLPCLGPVHRSSNIPSTKTIHDQLLRVLENRSLSSSHYLLTLETDAIAAAAQPGQFVMLRFPGCVDPLLPRPMSIANAVPPHGGRPGQIQILHKVVGKGTALLSALTPGDRLQVLGPLGRPFTVAAPAAPGARALMVAGGIGVAIFPFLVPSLKRAGWSPTLLFGARGTADLVEREWFAASGVEVRTATEDGSHGARGLVTALLEQELASGAPPGAAYACGPQVMLKAVSLLFNAASVPCQLSVESEMGCGIGACLGCVVKVRRGNDYAYVRVCLEGPTLAALEVLWE